MPEIKGSEVPQREKEPPLAVVTLKAVTLVSVLSIVTLDFQFTGVTVPKTDPPLSQRLSFRMAVEPFA
jgi:hypothetical protein